jgi:DNA-binding transcriptional LysR family regulator
MNSTQAIVAAVEAGVGVGFVSYLALEKALMLGTVRIIPLEKEPILRPLSLVLHEGPEARAGPTTCQFASREPDPETMATLFLFR